MRCRPDGNFKWILHAKGHFSKFSWAYPLESKETEPVAEKLLNVYSPPRILQSVNVKEFVARVIKVCSNTCAQLIEISLFYRVLKRLGLIW